MKVEYRSYSSRRPLPDENSVESMRASRSRRKFRIFCFQCGGRIWRTGPSVVRNAHAPGRALSRRHALMLRQTQGAFRTLGDSQLFYPSGGYKPMLSLTILVVSPNAFPPLFAPVVSPLAPLLPDPLEGLQPNPTRKPSDLMTAPPKRASG